MTSLLIVNPGAGPWWRRRLLGRVIERVRALLPDVVLEVISPARGTARLCADAAKAGVERVIIAGGDGTIHEAVNGLMSAPSPVRTTLAILPMGTSNVLAREIGLPLDPLQACRTLLEGAPCPIYLGRIDDRYFILMAGIGLDADVVQQVEQRWRMVKPWGGAATYALVGLAEMFTYRYPLMQVTIGGTAYAATTVIAAKARTYAGLRLVPGASLDQPELVIGLFHRAGWPAYLGYAARILFGRTDDMPGVTWLKTTNATLTAQTPIPVQADGEFIGRLPVRITVAPVTLQLWYPSTR